MRRAERGEGAAREDDGDMTMELEIPYDELRRTSRKGSEPGRMKCSSTAPRLHRTSMAAIREGRDCGDCLEKRLAEALSATASENPGFSWSVTSKREKALTIKSPNFEDAARRFYSNT